MKNNKNDKNGVDGNVLRGYITESQTPDLRGRNLI